MKIHEYQAKEIFRKFGVRVPRGIAVFSKEEALKAAKELGGDLWVVKSQIHAGGRPCASRRRRDRRGTGVGEEVQEVAAARVDPDMTA